MPTDKGIFVSGRVKLFQLQFVVATPVYAESLGDGTLSVLYCYKPSAGYIILPSELN